MSASTRYQPIGPFFAGRVPSGVKWLLISNIALFVAYFFAIRTGWASAFHPFGLIPAWVVERLAFWQLFSYMFLHDPRGFGHILFNMLTLWMFGCDLERAWGRTRFLQFYFLCGVGAGVCAVIGNAAFGTLNTRTIGASGAIYGILLAFGVLYPNATVLFSFLFPIKAKYFVLILGAIAFMSSLGASGSGVSHVAHLGGMVFGYLYLKMGFYRLDLLEPLRKQYRQWKGQRARKKFQVYMRKREQDRDRWIH